MARINLGIAFAGGGVRGAGHLGIVQALHENKIYPTIYTGASAGSIVASLLAYGYEPKEALAKFVEVSERMIDIAYGHILKGIFTTSSIEGFISGYNLEKLLHNMFSGAKLKDINSPLGIVTTDIDKGRQVIFSNKTSSESELFAINDDNFQWYDGKLLNISEIARASSGMPTIFLPKQIQNMKLVDGGITNNLPSDIAVALGADKVLSLDLGYSGETKTKGIIDIGSMSIDILMNRVIDGNRKDFGLYLNPKIYDVTALDSTRIVECYDRGYRYGLSQIDNIVKYLEEE